MNDFSLQGQIALVTGGGTGIGLATAQCLIETGAKVLIAGRREAVLREAVQSLGADARYLVHDVKDLAGAPEFRRRCEAEFGPVDCLINNAGGSVKRPALETTDDDLGGLLLTHVQGAFALAREFASGMVERGRGSIVFMMSMGSFIGTPNSAAYSAAKSAHFGLVRCLSVELAGSGVRVNGLAPGYIETEILRRNTRDDPERIARFLQRTPAGRLGTPREVGLAAAFLCMPAARFVNGSVLTVDGGASIGF